MIPPDAVRGRRVIHTTSAGTQGITHAVHAQDIITGSLVNAKAVADYLLAGNPEIVSLVAMGKAGEEPCEEDLLCAEYIRSMLLGRPMADIDERIRELRFHGESISSTPPHRRSTRGMISGCASCGTDSRLSCA